LHEPVKLGGFPNTLFGKNDNKNAAPKPPAKK